MAKQHVLDLERKREEQENDQILHTICFILFIYIYFIFKQGSRGTVIEATSRKDGKLKVKLDNDNTKTFRLINECDLQLYEGVSFNSQSQTEEQSFEY